MNGCGLVGMAENKEEETGKAKEEVAVSENPPPPTAGKKLADARVVRGSKGE